MLELLRPLHAQGSEVAFREGARQRHDTRRARRALQQAQQVLRDGLQGGSEAPGSLRCRLHHLRARRKGGSARGALGARTSMAGCAAPDARDEAATA